MRHAFRIVFPPLSIYNPAWVNRLPTGREQVRSLYGLVMLLSLFGGLIGAVFGRYLPIHWLMMPVCWIAATAGLYRLYNALLTDFRQSLLQDQLLSCTLSIGLMGFICLILAHLFSLMVFQESIRLAALGVDKSTFINWLFLSDSARLFDELTEPSVLLLWIWLQVMTQLLFATPFLLLFFTRSNLYTHLHHVRQILIDRVQTGRS